MPRCATHTAARTGILEEEHAAAGQFPRWFAGAARDRFAGLNNTAKLLRSRIERLGSTAPVPECETADIVEAERYVALLSAQLHTAVAERLSQASSSAQRLYTAVLASDGTEVPDVSTVRELRSLGLLRIVEDE